MLIVDINHGALDLALEYEKSGKVPVIWDIYGKLERDKNFKEENKNILSKFKIISKKETPEFSNYNEVIAPVHCPIDVKFKTFHDAVSEIISKKYPKTVEKMITITGVKGKTTTTELLKHILSEKYSVFCRNSNNGSITPVTVLNILNKLNEEKKLKIYDFLIFEISLGIVSSKYSILTNILENYSIAGGKRQASIKIDSLKNSKIVFVNEDLKNRFEIFHKNLKIVKNAKIISKYPLKFNYLKNDFEFNESVFGSHFIENSVFAIELCSYFMSFEEIKNSLKSFEIKNRMNVETKNNYAIVKNINPGLDLKAIDYAIFDFLNLFETGTIIVGGDFGCTCEEIDIKKLADLIKKYDRDGVKFLLSGSVGKNLKEIINLEFVDINNYAVEENTLVIYRSKLC
ncbi:coenzyme F430 synthase [Methanococcus maripaludis]|uniref:UDP-N-acetylmuramyl pentapeptide synthase n=1 Tax=Methanococcus maripaludis TaxID=39152 RepID=A0A8T4CNY9_METMI|nr:coenzyme F430 synthase [Methanococcus maripaludis]MBM7409915.1 UDP-N-acetylmuramyl pentapeptide synthase [Methanococcus maripaludis]MBP2219245.1 UDP-N-acetylmuramyl pentapeptide synthase [Methanococcus maripaludis]